MHLKKVATTYNKAQLIHLPSFHLSIDLTKLNKLTIINKTNPIILAVSLFLHITKSKKIITIRKIDTININFFS